MRKRDLAHVCWGCNKSISYETFTTPPRTWCGGKCRALVQRLAKASKNERYAPHDLRMFLLNRDRWLCFYCKTPVTNDTANMEHITPWPKGRTTSTNLVVACRDCNRSKRGKQGLHVAIGKRGQRLVELVKSKGGARRSRRGEARIQTYVPNYKD